MAYGNSFLAGIGLIAVRWAKVENELKLHTSALTAQETDGWPVHDLEIGFKRLRRLWLAQVNEHQPARAKHAKEIADNLMVLSKERAIALHGEWAPTKKRGHYLVVVLRQNRTIELGEGTATPRLLREVADRIAYAYAYAELRAFTRGKHGAEDTHPFLV